MEGAVPQPLHCPDFHFTPLGYWTFPEGSQHSQWWQANSHSLQCIRSECCSGKCCLYPLPSYTNIYYKVEQALRLVATGTLTIDMINAAKGKTVNLPKTMNLTTAKESMRQMGFSDVAWGKATHNYAKSAHSLSNAKFNIIIKEAKEFVKPIHGCKTTQATEVINVDEDDEWAYLVDNSDDESDDCKLF